MSFQLREAWAPWLRLCSISAAAEATQQTLYRTFLLNSTKIRMQVSVNNDLHKNILVVLLMNIHILDFFVLQVTRVICKSLLLIKNLKKKTLITIIKQTFLCEEPSYSVIIFFFFYSKALRAETKYIHYYRAVLSPS